MARAGEQNVGFNLLRLVENNLAEVLELESLAYDHPWTEANFRGEFKRPITLALGFKHLNKTLAAHCFFWIIPPDIHLLNLAVRPEYRGRGLARRLLKTMLSIGQRAGIRNFFLEVRPSNAPAVNLYRSFGFTLAGRRPAYYDNGEDAHLMTLKTFSETPGDR
jgi:ribosomal-protein-alanine N-acetyltransferase